MRFIQIFAVILALTACTHFGVRPDDPNPPDPVPRPAPDKLVERLIERLAKNPHLSAQRIGNSDTVLVQVRSGDSFPPDSVFPTKILTGVLDHVVSSMNAVGGKYIIKAVGHTDNVGSQQANIQASERRALNVVYHLVSKGIDWKLIGYEGKGSQEPIASNDTQEGRDVNRRVDLLIRPCKFLTCSAAD